MGHQGLHFLEAHPLFDCPFHSHEPYPVLIFKEFSNRSHTPVPEVIYIISHGLGRLQFDQLFDRGQDIFFS